MGIFMILLTRRSSFLQTRARPGERDREQQTQILMLHVELDSVVNKSQELTTLSFTHCDCI